MAAKYLTNHYDYWVGTGKAEVVYARAGNDDLFGLSGSDELHGGDGNDSIRGGNQADILYGDAGNDLLVGENGNDTLYGGKGNDTLTGLDGDDTVYGGDGNDEINSTRGLDTVFGGNGNDIITGGLKIDGGAGDDLIVSGSDIETAAHVIAKGGPGADAYEVGFITDGKQDIVEITDFSADDRGLVAYYELGGLNISGGTITSTPDMFNVQAQDHDIVVSTITDGDQLILRGAADWLHLA